MDKTEHILLAGKGAEAFAKEENAVMATKEV